MQGQRRGRRWGRRVHEQRREHSAKVPNSGGVFDVDQAGRGANAAPDVWPGGRDGGGRRPARGGGHEAAPAEASQRLGAEEEETLLRRQRRRQQRGELVLVRNVQPRVDPEQRVGRSTGKELAAIVTLPCYYRATVQSLSDVSVTHS